MSLENIIAIKIEAIIRYGGDNRAISKAGG